MLTPLLKLNGTEMKTEKVYLSLGSNLGDSVENLIRAVVMLDEGGLRVRKASGIYLSAPVGREDQPSFYNMVLLAETFLDPMEILRICQDTEDKLGRVRQERWGPRTIDIDILFIGCRKIQDISLEVPHPRLEERAFVLIPLREIDPAKFTQLRISIPQQKIGLLFSGEDVTMMLKNRGIFLV